MKRHLLFLAAMLSSWCVFAQPAPILRNPWTTNTLPQVSAGTNILIITNAGHKLVVNTFGLASQASFTSLSNSFLTLSNNFVTLSNNFVSLSNAAITGIVGRTNILASAATNHVITLDVIGGGGGGAFIPNLDGIGTNLVLLGDGGVALSIAGAPNVLALDVIGGNGTMALPTGGGISLIGGNGGDNFSGLGGFLLFQSGNGGLGAIAVDMTSPGGIGGVGGAFSFNSGQGGDGGEAAGDQVAGDGGVGAAFAITSGNGGAGGGGSAANPGGVGGNAGGITIMGGNAGLGGADGGGGAGANGTAGTITINGGQGGGSNATIFLQTFGGASLNIGGVNYKWPTAQGAAGTFLTNNGSGVLTWATLGSSADATKIAILGGGGTNNTFTNANFTNVTATGIPGTFSQGPGLTNDIARFDADSTNKWRITPGGDLFATVFSGLNITTLNTNLTNGPINIVVPAENGLEKFYLNLTTSNNVNLLQFYAGFSEYNLRVGPSSGAGAGFRLNTKSPETLQILSANNLGLARMDADQFVVPGRLELAGSSLSSAAQADVVSPTTNAVVLLGPPAASGLNTNGSVLRFMSLTFPFVNVMGGNPLLYATNNAGTTNLVAVDSKTNQVFLTTYFFETNTAAINTLQTNAKTLSTVRASISLTRTVLETARADAYVNRGGVFTLVGSVQAGLGLAATEIEMLSFDLNGAEAWYITNTSVGSATAVIVTNIISKLAP